MYTKIAVAAIVVMACFTTPAQDLINRFEREMAGMSALPTSQQQIEQRVDRAVFGDFDAMLADIH